MSILKRLAGRAVPGLAASPIDGDAKQVAWAIGSHLMAYPDGEIVERLPLLRDACSLLPEPYGSEVAAVVDRMLAESRTDDLAALQQEYVATFDTRRRGCLFLTYFGSGDTRRRGMALLEIKQTMRESGVELAADREDELPDHLCVVLEFAGTVDAEAGERILLDNRAGIELLRTHLQEIDSPWAPAIRMVCATMPALNDDDRTAIAKLAEQGPAQESVGLSGYGTDADYMASPPTNAPVAFTAPSGPVPLPTPRIRPTQPSSARRS